MVTIGNLAMICTDASLYGPELLLEWKNIGSVSHCWNMFMQ